MRKIRAYVDTSVFGGIEDEEFAEATNSFFDRVRAGEYVVLISRVTLDELTNAPSRVLEGVENLPEESVETCCRCHCCRRRPDPKLELPAHRELSSYPQVQRGQPDEWVQDTGHSKSIGVGI